MFNKPGLQTKYVISGTREVKRGSKTALRKSASSRLRNGKPKDQGIEKIVPVLEEACVLEILWHIKESANNPIMVILSYIIVTFSKK